MKKFITMAAAATLIATLPACGKTPMAPVATVASVQYSGDADIESTTGLHSAFKRIHGAIFDSMDANKDKFVDEYESGKFLTLEEFREANYNDNSASHNKLSKTEFIYWSTHVFLWIHTTAADWLNSFRSDLADVFDRLDKNHDGLISRKELNPTALNNIKLSFKYPKLHVNVPIRKISDDMFKASDKTGDSNLSQAEFEDLYVEMVVQALAPAAPAPAPNPPAPPAPPAPAAGGDTPAPAPAPAAGGDTPAPAPAGK